MHFIDFIIILLFAGALYRGYKRGLLLELTGFLALIPAFWVAANFSRAGASLIAPYAGRGLFLPFLGFLFIFLIVLFGTRYLMKLLRGLIRISLLGQADRLGGALFSFARIFLVTALLLYTAKSFSLLRINTNRCGAVCALTTDSGAKLVHYLSGIFFP